MINRWLLPFDLIAPGAGVTMAATVRARRRPVISSQLAAEELAGRNKCSDPRPAPPFVMASAANHPAECPFGSGQTRRELSSRGQERAERPVWFKTRPNVCTCFVRLIGAQSTSVAWSGRILSPRPAPDPAAAALRSSRMEPSERPARCGRERSGSNQLQANFLLLLLSFASFVPHRAAGANRKSRRSFGKFWVRFARFINLFGTSAGLISHFCSPPTAVASRPPANCPRLADTCCQSGSCFLSIPPNISPPPPTRIVTLECNRCQAPVLKCKWRHWACLGTPAATTTGVPRPGHQEVAAGHLLADRRRANRLIAPRERLDCGPGSNGAGGSAQQRHKKGDTCCCGPLFSKSER